jgi:hypothetical protein
VQGGLLGVHVHFLFLVKETSTVFVIQVRPAKCFAGIQVTSVVSLRFHGPNHAIERRIHYATQEYTSRAYQQFTTILEFQLDVAVSTVIPLI